jgi:streptogramin lyase
MRRGFGVVAALLAIGLSSVVVPAAAEPAHAPVFPRELALPGGFLPEGIGIGAWPIAYFGSRADGRIFQVNLVNGRGSVLSPGPGTPSLGIKVDSARGRLFVAGGTGGDARVIDARDGKVLASYKFRDADTFVNDLVITRQAVWFTDSRQPTLYKVPLGRHGQLPDQSKVEKLPLTGELVVVPGATNANGIVSTPDGRGLLIGQSNTGKLFRVDPATGVTDEVDLAGASLPSNDGLLREGKRLYVVQNRLNLLAKVELRADGRSGQVVRAVTDPGFDVPATVAEWGNRFYLVNARFTTPPTPTTPYNAVAIAKF